MCRMRTILLLLCMVISLIDVMHCRSLLPAGSRSRPETPVRKLLRSTEMGNLVSGTNTKLDSTDLYRLDRLRGGSIDRTGAVTDLHGSKMIVQVALTLFNIMCWAIPLSTRHFTQNAEMLSMSNAFAGGIFLMLSFGHLLPEAVATMAAAKPALGPTVLVYTLFGFMAMLFIEKVAFSSKDKVQAKEGVHLETAATAAVRETALLNSRAQSAMALCSAMSVHSFFESAALGLTTDTTSLYMMAACIALHQPAESLALLVSFLKSGLSTRVTATCLTVFSLVSPVGLMAGMMVKTLTSGATEAVIMAVTAGTFVYVGATEIANEEFDETASFIQRLQRFVLLLLGMGVMHQIATVTRASAYAVGVGGEQGGMAAWVRGVSAMGAWVRQRLRGQTAAST